MKKLDRTFLTGIKQIFAYTYGSIIYIFTIYHEAFLFRTEVWPAMWSSVLSCNGYLMVIVTNGTMFTGFGPELGAEIVVLTGFKKPF